LGQVEPEPISRDRLHPDQTHQSLGREIKLQSEAAGLGRMFLAATGTRARLVDLEVELAQMQTSRLLPFRADRELFSKATAEAVAPALVGPQLEVEEEQVVLEQMV
jgi:hypothetical protein